MWEERCLPRPFSHCPLLSCLMDSPITTVDLPDFDAAIYKKFLRYCYTGRLQIDSAVEAKEFSHLAFGLASLPRDVLTPLRIFIRRSDVFLSVR